MSSSNSKTPKYLLAWVLLHLSAALAGLNAARSSVEAAESDLPALPAIVPSPRTTRVTEPLDEEGYVDFIGALNAKLGTGVAPAENAAIPLLQAMGPSESNGRIPNLILKELGARPWQAGDVDFQSYGELSKAANGENADAAREWTQQYDQALSGPWTEQQFPKVAAVLISNQRALDAISIAVQRPKYFRPLVRQQPTDDMISILLPDIQESRDIARQLQCRAMLHLGYGRLNESRSDLLAMHRLAGHIAHGATLIEGLVGVAIDTMAMTKDIVWALHPDQTAESIAAYRAELKSIPWTGDFSQSLDLAERYMGLDVVQGIARGRGTSAFADGGLDQSASEDLIPGLGLNSAQFTQMLTAMTLDWNATLATMQPIYDDLVAIARIPSRTQRLAAIAAFDQRLAGYRRESTSLSGIVTNVFGGNKLRGQNFARMLASLLVPAVAQAREAEDRVQTRLQVRDFFLAAVEYRLTEGTYPENLDVLVSKVADRSPIDVYSERPLRYMTDGTTLKIYSLGTNGIDNQGQTFGSGEGHDDLVFTDPPLPPPQ